MRAFKQTLGRVREFYVFITMRTGYNDHVGI